MPPSLRRPPLAIAQSDHSRLLRLAESIERANAELSGQLFIELERAEVLPDVELRDDVVGMGATLDYQTDAGETRTVTLVYPGEENITDGRVSILTPIGVALIGLPLGSPMDWRTRDGRLQALTVTRIDYPPENADTNSLATAR
jgi:regulator of nucleoside diphosphate kinase